MKTSKKDQRNTTDGTEKTKEKIKEISQMQGTDGTEHNKIGGNLNLERCSVSG